MDPPMPTQELQAAREILQEIWDALERLGAWYTRDVTRTCDRLYGDWTRVCREFASTHSEGFRSECQELLDGCVSLQNAIRDRTSQFTEMVDDRLPAIRALARKDAGVESLVTSILGRYNATDHPNLMQLYGRAEKLEVQIREAAAM